MVVEKDIVAISIPFSAGVVLAALWPPGSDALWAVAAGSCLAAAFLAVMVWFPVLGVRGAADLPQCVLVTLVALFVIWKHRSNIKRLATGCESKIYLFGRRKDG